MTGRPPDKLEMHARRIEGRRLTQAFLDGEITEASPRLRELLAQDAVLRQELSEYKELNSFLGELPQGNDLSASILNELNNRPVFLPQERPKRGALQAISLGFAASLALGSGAIWLATSAQRSTPPVQIAMVDLPKTAGSAEKSTSPNAPNTDLVGDARETIWTTTGMSTEERNLRRSALLTQANDGAQVLDVDLIAAPQRSATPDSYPRQVAGKMAGKSEVQITRSGASVVNPGPQFAAVKPASREAAAVWKAMPNAEYSGGRSRTSDSPRFVVGSMAPDANIPSVPVSAPIKK